MKGLTKGLLSIVSWQRFCKPRCIHVRGRFLIIGWLHPRKHHPPSGTSSSWAPTQHLRVTLHRARVAFLVVSLDILPMKCPPYSSPPKISRGRASPRSQCRSTRKRRCSTRIMQQWSLKTTPTDLSPLHPPPPLRLGISFPSSSSFSSSPFPTGDLFPSCPGFPLLCLFLPHLRSDVVSLLLYGQSGGYDRPHLPGSRHAPHTFASGSSCGFSSVL